MNRMTGALVGLAGLLAVATILGPLGAGVIEWRVSANVLNQTYGADGAALVLLVPASLVAAWAWQRPDRLATPLSFGIALASLYYAIASVLGANYTSFDGNNERFFLLFLGIIVLAGGIAIAAWAALDPSPPVPSRPLARATGTVLIVGALAIAAAWLNQLVQIAVSGSIAAAGQAQEYADAPAAFWLVRIVDLGFIVPAALYAGVGLWRAWPTAIRASYGVTTFMTLQAATVLAMALIMLWRNDPAADPMFVLVLGPITIAIAALTVALLRSYRDSPMAQLDIAVHLAYGRHPIHGH